MAVLGNAAQVKTFGHDVARVGEFIAVGAPSGSNAFACSNYGICHKGVVTLFRETIDGWIVHDVLHAEQLYGLGLNFFGRAISGSGERLAVADLIGVYLYSLDAGVLKQDQFLSVQGGTAVTSDLNENVLVIGSPNADSPSCPSGGTVFVYSLHNGEWVPDADLFGDYCQAGSNLFGYSVASAADVILVGDHTHDGPVTNTGAVFAFRRIDGEWVLEQELKPSDVVPGGGPGTSGSHWFGYSVAMDAAGKIAIIGAPDNRIDGLNQAGSTYVFEYDGENWVETAKLTANPPVAFSFFGENVAIAEDGNTIIVVPLFTVKSHVFRRVGGQWVETAVLPGAGEGVAIHGDMALVTGLDRTGFGQVHVFSGINDIDCNNNGIADGCDIAMGFSKDVNGDGIPDECQAHPDLTGDGVVGVPDLLALLGHWGQCERPAPPIENCPADLTGDGAVGVPDLLLLLSAWGEYPPQMPVTSCGGLEGDCCTVNGTPGCSDGACCESVCASDPFCCNVAWDITCMNAARGLCGCQPPAACSDRDAGNCCTPGGGSNGGPGCADSACCTHVCDYLDSYCCDVEWDHLCTQWAFETCECAPANCGPGSGSCCMQSVGFPAGCSDVECCALVCAQKPSCCSLNWDVLCRGMANQLCDVCQDD